MDVSAADPVSIVDALGSVPLLVIQGTDDQSVGPDAAEQIAAEAQTGNVQVELHLCPGAGHGLSREVCAAEYRDWVLGFLARTQAP